MDKREAAAQLVEDKLPLFSADIRRALDSMHKGPFRPSSSVILELIKSFPDHFTFLIENHTRNYEVEGEVVWTNPATQNDYQDCDVEVVRRYIVTCRKLYLHYLSQPHDHFVQKCGRYARRKRMSDAATGALQDENRFFSLPFATASEECWERWTALPRLTAEECATLSLGCDPDVVTLQRVEDAVGKGYSAFLTAFRSKKLLFERLASAKGTQASTWRTSDFLKWATQEGLVPTASPSTTMTARTVADNDDSREVSRPAITSLYKIMFSFALIAFPDLIARLNEDALKSKHNKAKTVAGDIERYLMPVINGLDDKTISRYLVRAHSYLSGRNILVQPAKPPTRKPAAVGKSPQG